MNDHRTWPAYATAEQITTLMTKLHDIGSLGFMDVAEQLVEDQSDDDAEHIAEVFESFAEMIRDALEEKKDFQG